jgi:SAM-dependent methyltransferase
MYLAFHAPRYVFALDTLVRHIPATGPGARVLDVGPSKLTTLIHEALGNRVPVDSLGFAPDGASPTGQHYCFDLNDVEARGRWRSDLPAYDAVVMAEVIEHLHVAPTHVLAFLRSLLRPGGVLLLQTPNAVALHQRLEMLLGRHPYELIREDPKDPGHFREYTAAELRAYARAAGFAVEDCAYRTYFDYRFARHRASDPRRPVWYLGAVNLAYALVPPRLKPGLSLVLKLKAAVTDETG